MNLPSPQSENARSGFWSWSGWRGVAVAVATLMVGIPAVCWYASQEAHNPVQAARLPPPPPMGPDGRFGPYPPPPRPIHSVKDAHDASGMRLLKIRATDSGDEIVIDAVSGKVLEVHDTDGKKLWSSTSESEVSPETSPHPIEPSGRHG